MDFEDKQIEELLLRYHISSPPMELKERVLSSSRWVSFRWKVAGWAAVAAVLMVSIGLYWATIRMERQMSGMFEPGQIWNTGIDELAQMMDGDGTGRRYLALRLTAACWKAKPETLSLIDNLHTGEM